MRVSKHLATLAVMLALTTPSFAAVGSEADCVPRGQLAALENPAGALGIGIREGIVTAIEEANRASHGRGLMVRIYSLDDGHRSDRSLARARTVIARDGNIGVIGTVGASARQSMRLVTTPGPIPAAPVAFASLEIDGLGFDVESRNNWRLETVLPMRTTAAGGWESVASVQWHAFAWVRSDVPARPAAGASSR
jgi:hypothetical protein